MRCRLLFLLFAAVTCGGCSTQKGSSASADVAPGSAQVDSLAAPFTIVAVRVEQDSLFTELRYGGGFQTHEFALVSAGAATKSLPRQQPLRITHDAQGDMGRALITTREAFDLTPFRDPTQPLIRLALQGWPEQIDYTYSD